MCGIVAIVSRDSRALESIDLAVDSLTHRGPDDRGSVIIGDGGVALGMRRLSIVDLSGGAQPMWDHDRTVCVVFNGEIYNAPHLRELLRSHGHSFETDHSDTEVLVHGFKEWGVDLFPRLNGMFAVAIWDCATRTLSVARDRIGEKPLYVAQLDGGVAIASEIKALLKMPGLSRDIDVEGLEQYLAFDYALPPRTLLSAVSKLPAGHLATVVGREVRTCPYWTPSFRAIPTDRTDLSLQDELEAHLDRSVRMRLMADVPVGLFLSGGLDSTTVGYFMRRHADLVDSYSIGFEESAYDESTYSRLAAEALGTRHHEEVLSQRRALDLVPRITDLLDEPMGDPSIFPTFLLSQFTRRDVKVALGGDGSDELLLGYKAHRPLGVAAALDRMPASARRLASLAAVRVPDRVGTRPLKGVVFARRLGMRPTERMFAHLGAFKGDARWLLSHDVRSRLRSEPAVEAAGYVRDGLNGLAGMEETTAAYVRGYLQNDILVKVDRASMAASLEVRSPFLDPELVDFLIALPRQKKFRRMRGKVLLRELMRDRIPDVIIDRPKQGFGVPLGPWFRGSLAPLAKDLLSPDRLRSGGLLDPKSVNTLLSEHLSGAYDHGNRLWLLVQLELWRDRWLP
jgi:asparagine synthase (glutamine-hydrolysing)